MQEISQDLFRQALENARKSGVWENLTPVQKEALSTQYLRQHFSTTDQ